MKKIIIAENIKFSSLNSIYDFDGDIDKVISMLENLKKEHSEYSNLCIDICVDHDSTDNNMVEITLHGDRPETEKEKNKRLITTKRIKEKEAKESKKQKEQVKTWEEKTYLRLKKKFEKGK